MSDKHVEISIPADDEGYVSLECLFCNEYFKLDAGGVEEFEGIELFCPYCGLADEASSFISKEVEELAHTIAENTLIDMLNDFGKDMERTFRNNSNVTFKLNPIKKITEPELRETESNFTLVNLKCCNSKVKVLRTMEEHITVCPYCGVR